MTGYQNLFAANQQSDNRTGGKECLRETDLLDLEIRGSGGGGGGGSNPLANLTESKMRKIFTCVRRLESEATKQ